MIPYKTWPGQPWAAQTDAEAAWAAVEVAWAVEARAARAREEEEALTVDAQAAEATARRARLTAERKAWRAAVAARAAGGKRMGAS